MTASWPTSIPTTAELRGDIVDNCATLLSGALLAAATTILVDSAADFPTAGLLSIRKANGSGSIELCSYTGKTGVSFTGVTRNFNSRYNAAWAEDDVVELLWAADHHNRTVQEIIAIATDLNGRIGKGQGNYIIVPNGVGIIFTVGSKYYLLTVDAAGIHTAEVTLS